MRRARLIGIRSTAMEREVVQMLDCSQPISMTVADQRQSAAREAHQRACVNGPARDATRAPSACTQTPGDKRDPRVALERA